MGSEPDSLRASLAWLTLGAENGFGRLCKVLVCRTDRETRLPPLTHTLPEPATIPVLVGRSIPSEIAGFEAMSAVALVPATQSGSGSTNQTARLRFG